MKKMLPKILWFFVFLVTGLLVFVVFSHMRPWLSGFWDWGGRIVLSIILLGTGLFLKRTKKFNDHGEVFFGFFIALLAISIDLYMPSTQVWLDLFQVPLMTPRGVAIDKLDSTLWIVLTILGLTLLSRRKLGSMGLQKGKLRRGLIIGLISFVICFIGSYFLASVFGAVNLTLERMIPWLPWILLFILGNAFNEELLFRGLFLNKMKPILGPLLTNLVLILPFVLHHTGVTYTNDALMFLAYLLPLAFVWGWLSQKTDSLLASVLFHAGTDVTVILVIFSQM